MLINKSILGGALSVCAVDKEFPLLNCVCIEPDGTIVAMNKMVLYVAEPVTDKIPFGSLDKLPEQVVLPADSAQHLFKAITVDRIFKGKMEHSDILLSGINDVDCEVRDGQRSHVMKLKRIKKPYMDWRSLVRSAWANRGSVIQGVYNRKRLVAACNALEGACKYDGSFSPVFVEFSGTDRVIWRARNELTNQRVMIIFTFSEIKEKWPELNEWENSICGAKRVFTRRTVC